MEIWSRALRREVRRSARVVVLGVGNVARGDDAAGVLVARGLLAECASQPERALVIEAGEVPENYTGVVRAFSPDLTVVVDSSKAGRPPGAVFLVEPAEIADEDLSTHRIPLSRLTLYIQETMGSRVMILGIEPGSCEEGARLSPAVGLAVRNVVAALARALAAKG